MHLIKSGRAGGSVTPQRSWGFFYSVSMRWGNCVMNFDERCTPNTVSQHMHDGFIYSTTKRLRRTI
eukprot:11911430-Ditylum_brightwellii.AAC.1